VRKAGEEISEGGTGIDDFKRDITSVCTERPGEWNEANILRVESGGKHNNCLGDVPTLKKRDLPPPA